jgi:hypothetical protein
MGRWPDRPRTDISTKGPQPSSSWQARASAVTGKARQRVTKHVTGLSLPSAGQRCCKVGAGRFRFECPGFKSRISGQATGGRRWLPSTTGAAGARVGHARARCAHPIGRASLTRPSLGTVDRVTRQRQRNVNALLLYAVLGQRSGDV